MKLYVAAIVAVLSLSALLDYSEALSCSIGRVACIASCNLQNCGTGYCDGDICRCSRCGSGSNWDVGIVFKFGIPVRQRQEGSTSIVVPKDVGDVEACGTLTATGDFGNRTIVVGTFTEDGTASAGADYNSEENTLHFNMDNAVRCFGVQIYEDNFHSEGLENFKIKFETPQRDDGNGQVTLTSEMEVMIDGATNLMAGVFSVFFMTIVGLLCT